MLSSAFQACEIEASVVEVDGRRFASLLMLPETESALQGLLSFFGRWKCLPFSVPPGEDWKVPGRCFIYPDAMTFRFHRTAVSFLGEEIDPAWTLCALDEGHVYFGFYPTFSLDVVPDIGDARVVPLKACVM